jgi:hypothetical protein
MDVPADKRVGPPTRFRAALKEGPAVWLGKAGAKSLWGSGEERGPRPLRNENKWHS